MNNEIFVDGVNVAGCMHYDKPYCDQSYSGEGGLLKNTPNPKKCEGRKNCDYKQLQRLQAENSRLKNGNDYQVGALKNTIDKLIAENEELKKANIHIETNRKCKGEKLKRIEELIINCESGYTDEFIQSILAILLENEPSVTDLSIIDRYKQALEELYNIAIDNVRVGRLMAGAWLSQKINEVLKDE